MGLRKHGFRTIEARDGRQALESLADSKQQVDILLTDVVMPGMDGHQLSRDALQVRPSLKVMLMSGYAGHATTDALEQNVSFIEKPFTLEDLVAQLHGLFLATGEA